MKQFAWIYIHPKVSFLISTLSVQKKKKGNLGGDVTSCTRIFFFLGGTEGVLVKNESENTTRISHII